MKKLTEAAFQSAAKYLGCDVPAIKAVCEVEAPKGGFLPDGRVTILFERHKFHQYTAGVYSKDYPDISNRKPGGYGAEGAHQWDRFDKAAELDSEAAMKATSWGKFQIMGSNFPGAGYGSVGEFVEAMKVSEDEQLEAFVEVVKSFGLADELRSHNWAAFARGYNGANYQINHYDTKLRAAYLKHKNDEPEADSVPDPPEEPKTQPPPSEITAANSTVVTPSQMSVPARATAMIQWIVGGLSWLGISVVELTKKLYGAATDNPWVVVALLFFGAAVILSGTAIFISEKHFANQRTLKAADLAGAQDKNNIYFGETK